MPEYAIILALFLAVAVTAHRMFKVAICSSKKQLLISMGSIAVIGIFWDYFAIVRGYWSFGDKYLLGIKLGVLPIEEVGFMFIMPYFFLVLYKVVEKYLASPKDN